MATKNYSFFVKNKIPVRQKILGFSVGAFLFAGLIYYFIVSIDAESLWMPILIFAGGMLFVFYIVHQLLRDKKPLQEKIKLTEKGMISQIYGEVQFKEIRFMVEEELAGEIVFLQIFLQNGRKIIWKRSDYRGISAENISQFSHFYQDIKQAFEEFKIRSKTNFPHRHQFTFYKESGYFYALICIVFVPFILLFDDVNDLGLWALPVIFIPVISGIWLTIKKVVQQEEVDLFEDHLISKKYGRIDFKNITEIISYEDNRRPSLILKLRNAQHVSWKTPVLGANQTDRENKLMFVEIRHFITDFTEITAVFSNKIHVAEIGITNSVQPKSRNTSVEASPQFSEPNSVPPKNFNRKPQVIPHTRKKSSLYIAVPAGLAVSILILSRNCVGTYQKKKSPFYQIEQKTENVQRQAQVLLKGFTEKNGPYYLLSNRDSVEIFYYPTKKNEKELSRAEALFEREKRAHSPENLLQINRSLEFYREMNYARQYPDSVDWHLLLSNFKTEIPLHDFQINQAESRETFLYLAYFIPDVLITRTPVMRAYAKGKDLPATENRFGSFAIPITENSSPVAYFEHENFPLERFLEWKEKYSDQMQIYLVAQQKAGISEDQFKEFSSEILGLLHLEKGEFTFKKLAYSEE